MTQLYGNPTSYLGKTLTWSKGRLLTQCATSSMTVTMGYDANGIRKSKQIASKYVNTVTSYIYDSLGRLRTEVAGSFTRNYLYSEDGIIGYEENGEKFLYRKNLFGDVTAIYRGTTKVAEYVYDAWGNCRVTYDNSGYGTRNPFRYRGYYWDNDLGMYYLMTRYYDPSTARFINSDTPEYLDPNTINGLNLYAYCNNNPVMYVDPSGHFHLSIDDASNIVGVAIVAAIVILLVSAIDSSNSEMSRVWKDNSFSPDFDWDWIVSPTSLGPEANTEKHAYINFPVSICQAKLYFDANKTQSLYANLLSISVFAGFDIDESMYGFFVDVGILNIGYDGTYFDIGVSTIGAGLGLGWQDGNLVGKFDPIGYFGIDASVNFGVMIKDLLQ